MLNILRRTLALFAIGAPTICCAQITSPFVETFASDPTQREWGLFGESALIRWNADEQNLAVTWDSSKPNSYLRLPLPSLTTRGDDFSAELDLLLYSYAAGVNPQKTGTFQLAFGFQNFADAAAVSFMRAAPNAAPNLVEFNFMPDTGFGSTVWPAILSTNGAMNYSGSSDFNVFDLPLNTTMRIAFSYASSNETATIAITADGVLVGPVTSARLATNDVGFGRKFTQFKVDAFAIASYSDAGQSGPFQGSVLARGIIDNVILRFPPPPITNLRGDRNFERFEARFTSRANWIYRLLASEDFAQWTALGQPVLGSGEEMALQDSASRSMRFYRVAAQPVE